MSEASALSSMDALGHLTIGMSAEMRLVVTEEMTIRHFVPGMPHVYATPMMVLHMEMAAGSAIASALPSGFVSVGMEVNVRHLAPTPAGGKVHVIGRVIAIGAKSVLFDLEAWNEVRKIGEGTHRRGVVNLREFESRFGVKDSALV
jgi:fluoroacetyl-CoA thioesterase